jgi:predicted neuraminidase
VAKNWTLVLDWNAVPTGEAVTVKSVGECEARCACKAAAPICTQFSFNLHSGHCYTSESKVWAGLENDRVTSGCRPDEVAGCPSRPPPPAPPPPVFDGVLRATGDGRLDAYMIPPFASSHASMVEQTEEGRLHLAWFSGTAEGQDDVSIVYSQLNATAAEVGAAWSTASVVSRREGFSNQNAVLFANASTLHVFHSQQPASKGEKTATVWHLSAAVYADGRTGKFSEPHEVFPAPGSFDKNRVLRLLDGSWLIPLYNAANNTPFNGILSAGGDPDSASSWRPTHNYVDCSHLVQPTVVRVRPGSATLVAFFRDREMKQIYSARSTDDGTSWSPCKPTSLPNNNAGIEAWVLRSGRVALVYNPQTSGRDPLAISLSEDGGATWKFTRLLEHEDGKQEFSYPTVREDVGVDGVLHVSYTFKRQTIKHSVISEEWIMRGARVDE